VTDQNGGMVRIPWTLLLLSVSVVGAAITLYERITRLEAEMEDARRQFSSEHGQIMTELQEVEQFEAGEKEHGKAQDIRLEALERRGK
jgi:hypothetical protein